MKYLEMKTKVSYASPQWDVIRIAYEQDLLQASPYNDDGNEELDPDGEENW